MKKILCVILGLAIATSASHADGHLPKSMNLQQLVDQHGLKAAVAAGIMMSEGMTLDQKVQIRDRFGGKDSYDICNWCECCVVKNLDERLKNSPQIMQDLLK